MGALSSLLKLASRRVCSLQPGSLGWGPLGGGTSKEVPDLRRESRTERGCLNLPGPGEVLWRGVWSQVPKVIVLPSSPCLLWEVGEATASLLDRLGDRKKDALP